MTSSLSTLFGIDTLYSSAHQYPGIYAPSSIVYDASSTRLIFAHSTDSAATSSTVSSYNLSSPPANNSTLPKMFNTLSGERITSMALYGSGVSQYLYVAYTNGSAYKLYKVSTTSPNPTTEITFVSNASNDTGEKPKNIIVDSSQNIYNLDSTSGNITKLTSGGIFTYITGKGAGPFTSGPYSMVINSDGTAIYVIGNNKVQKVLLGTGAVSILATDSRIQGSTNGAFLNNKATYIIFQSTSNRIFYFNISINSINIIAGNGNGVNIVNASPTPTQGDFSSLAAICQDPFNNLYACDFISNSTALNVLSDSTAANKGYIRLFANFDPDSAPCFKEGTKILTDKGYVPVEDLRKGDMVKTVKNGFVPIYEVGVDTINHQCCEERADHQLYVCKSQNYPELLEDLVITGFHSLLVEDFANEEQKEETRLMLSGLPKSDGYYLLPSRVDKRSEVFGEKGIFKVYHVALEDEDEFVNHGIYANGLLVESISKDMLIKNSGMKLLQS
jgi:hypothetical protein